MIHAEGIRLAHPATAWAQLGHWSLLDLVALGDYFCREWRTGPGRPTPGLTPLATRDELRAELASARRHGAARLRQALALIREDAWSPRESMLRCQIVLAGLPEPALNHDVWDRHGRHLACVDLAYPELRIAIEYHGRLHHARYAEDVERVAALRANGWIVLEVTSTLYAHPDELLSRIRAAIASRR